MQHERRHDVRMKPSPELPARAVLASAGVIQESVEVIDISIGGIALGSPALTGAKATDRLHVKLSLTGHADHIVVVEVRWARGESLGALYVESSPEAKQAIRRYVAELLERGKD